MAKKIFVGISGWTYPDWRDSFYPEDVRTQDELRYASHTFNTIEVNGTFYSLQKPHTFEKWYDETPIGFVFAIKGPKYVTHERRLKDVKTPMANFFASGILALKDKLGPILWQLPPHLPYDAERMEAFLALLPHTTSSACDLGVHCSDWMKERSFLKSDEDRPILHCVEVRHESFQTLEFYAMMKRYGVAIVIGDTAGRWPLIKEQTSKMTYIRMHGDAELYPQGYTKPALKTWAKDIKAFAETSEYVFAFCDNDHKTAAPLNAKQLMDYLEIDWKPQFAAIKQKKAPLKTSKATANNRAVAKTARSSRTKDKPLNRGRKIA